MAQELAGTNKQIRVATSAAIRSLIELLAACVTEAIASREINPTLGAMKTAKYLEASWRGALLMARAEQSIVPLETFCAMLPQILNRRN